MRHNDIPFDKSSKVSRPFGSTCKPTNPVELLYVENDARTPIHILLLLRTCDTTRDNMIFVKVGSLDSTPFVSNFLKTAVLDTPPKNR
jgi:hypothetical protein